MGSVGNNSLPVLTISNNIIRYPDRENLYRDLNGSIQYYAYENPMRKLGERNGVEYGIVGNKRTTNSRYNYTAGHIGYKIDNGVVYITQFSPQTIAKATQFVKEDIKDDSKWIKLGRIK